jgi:hypothetical protein
VWDNVDQYPSLSARTVTADRALSRLESLAGITFADAEKKALASCRKTRNAIEHYEFVIGEKEAKIVLGRTLSFIFSFARTELQLNLEEEFRSDDTWNSLIEQFHEFAQSHASKISQRLSAEGRITIECPNCDYDTVDVFDETCAFCGQLWTPDEDDDDAQGVT